MKLLKEKIAALEAMEEQLNRRYKAVECYKKRSGNGEQNNFKGELYIWDESSSGKFIIQIGALFTDREIVAAIEKSIDCIENKSLEIRPVLEMAELALKN